MSSMSGKKILLFGFILVLLVTIPVTIYLVQQQQETRGRAEKSTTITLLTGTPPSSSAEASIGEEITFNVSLDPGTNQVNWVKFTLSYDETKLATTTAGLEVSSRFRIVEGPTYAPGTITVGLGTGMSPDDIIQTTTNIATLHMSAIGRTDAAPTQITFGQDTQVRSVASTDLPGGTENVLSSAAPANVTIGGEEPTPTPTAEPTMTVTPTPTMTASPTPNPTANPTVTPSPAPIAENAAPICSSISIDTATGTAPLTVTFTTNGADNDGTISKISLNFGDSSVQEITDGSGIGTGTVSAQVSHTFNAGGIFTANATFTDNQGANSDPATCQQTITVQGEAAPVITSTPAPIPSEAPGPGDMFIAMGTFGAILSVIGIVLLFAL